MSETSIWGGDDPLVAWNQNSWQSNITTVSLTGVSATTSVGSVNLFLKQDGVLIVGAMKTGVKVLLP